MSRPSPPDSPAATARGTQTIDLERSSRACASAARRSRASTSRWCASLARPSTPSPAGRSVALFWRLSRDPRQHPPTPMSCRSAPSVVTRWRPSAGTAAGPFASPRPADAGWPEAARRRQPAPGYGRSAPLTAPAAQAADDPGGACAPPPLVVIQGPRSYRRSEMTTTIPAPEVRLIPLPEIRDVGNVRRELRDIESRAPSIRLHGLLTAIAVEALPDGGYRLAAGSRRFAAAQLAELDAVPAVIVPPEETPRRCSVVSPRTESATRSPISRTPTPSSRPLTSAPTPTPSPRPSTPRPITSRPGAPSPRSRRRFAS